MNIYKFHNADQQAYVTASSDVCDQCEPEPPRSIAVGWTAPTFKICTNDAFRTSLPKRDFLTFVHTAPMLTARAVERLQPILAQCGEILPIRFSNDRDSAFLFNVTRLLDAVDMKHSEFMQLPSGAIGPCKRLVLDPTVIPDEAIFFKMPQLGPAGWVFATEQAVTAVKRARLTGHDFELVWTNE